jgi:arylsulfatase A-like enzyme
MSARFRSAPASALALYAGWLTFFALLWASDLNRVSAFSSQPVSSAIEAAIAAMAALLAAVGIHTLASGGRLDWEQSIRIISAIVAFLGLVLSAQVLGVSGLILDGTAARILGSAGCVVLLGVALWAIRRVRVGSIASGILVTLGILLLLPIWPLMRHLAASNDQASEGGSPKPPIILITIDTLRRDALSCYDPDGPPTPQIDSLASHGLRFTAAFSGGPWTIPSFVSLMTGVPVDIHGVNHNFATIPARYETLAEQLRDAGYRTAALGHHPQLLRMDRGFDHFDFTPREFSFHARMTGAKLLWRLLRESYSTGDLPNLVRNFLNAQSGTNFFLWVHFLDPHSPYEPPKRFTRHLDEQLIRDFGTSSEGITVSQVRSGRLLSSPRQRKWLRELYDAEVRWVDESVGRIVEELKAHELFDQAIVVLVADHGEEFWDHGGWEHGHTLYDELVRVPLIVKLPNIARSGIVDFPTSIAAIAPTLLDLAGASIEPTHGIASSITSSLLDGVEAPSHPIPLAGIEYFDRREAVVFDEFKFVHWLESGRKELFDLTRDPMERTSLVSERQDLVQRAMGMLEQRAQIKASASGATDFEKTDPRQPSPSVLEHLRALGYVE